MHICVHARDHTCKAMLFSPYVSYSFIIISSVFFIGIFCGETKKGMPLNDYIHHFEPLFYDHRHLQEQHRRSRTNDQFSLKFSAHQRFFHLRLKRDTSVFADDTEFLSAKKPMSYDTTRVLTGYLDGEEDSSIEAIVTSSGFLNGVVKIGSEEFYIEPALNYFDPAKEFHSVIYKLSDVHFPQANATCLSHLMNPFAYSSKLSSKKTVIRHSSRADYNLMENCSPTFSCNHMHELHSFNSVRPRHRHRFHGGKFSAEMHNKKSLPISEIPVYTTASNFVKLARSKREHNKRHHGAKSKKNLQTPSSFAVNKNFNYSLYLKKKNGYSLSHFLLKSSQITSFKNVLKQQSGLWVSSPYSAMLKGYSIDAKNDGLSFESNHANTVNNPLKKLIFPKLKFFSKNIPFSSIVDVSKQPSTPFSKHDHDIRNDLYPFISNVNHTKFFVKTNATREESILADQKDSGTDDRLDQATQSSLSIMEMSPMKNSNSGGNVTIPAVFANHPNLKRSDSNMLEFTKKEDPPYWRELDALHYTEDGRTGSSEPYGVRSIQRTQWTEERGQRHVAVDRRKSTCLLYLQADHLFYQRMGSEEACIEAMTRHVQRVNSIYRMTDFDQDGRPDNISFLIKRIKVHTTPEDDDYRFVGSYGVEKFLELFSEDDYDAFCLAYMFTYRDFEGGTLGLAWTGDLKNAGGVCEKNGHYRGSLKSLNTGIITLLNYGKHVPPVVSHVTLAHEIGHNFGSPHDPEDDQHCTPGGEHGNYIMFARATSGDKRNNNRFSPCSLKSINAVLNTKARSVKGCFTEPLDAVCGNEVVEGAEECDCGWEEDCHEPCCFPMRVNPPQDQPPCRLRPAAFCSPSQGPCCSHDCRLKYGAICREDNGCRTASYCDGQGPQCPPSTNKPNKTVCSEEFVCYNGECTGSICMAYGLESCQCLRTIHDPFIRSCELCCKLPGDESSCKSSFEWNMAPYDVPDLYAKPGAPCDNYNGYCDVYQSCREIDPSGPLATLRKLLLTPEGAVILKRWFAERWWSVLLLFSAISLTAVITVRLIIHGQTKNFLSTILPHQADFHFCHGRSNTPSQSAYMVTPASRTTNCIARPRISSAPENGWV